MFKFIFYLSAAFLLISSPVFAQYQWNSQTSGTTNFLGGVYFTDINNGWAIGGTGIVLNTTNGGTNWNTIGGTGSTIHSVFFLDSNNGWISGNGKIWYRQHYS